jgi:hypothetical protein
VKKSGTPAVTLSDSKGLVDKFRPEAFASPKVQVVPGNNQVFVLINDKDENLGEYLKQGAKLNIGTLIDSKTALSYLLLGLATYDYPFGLDKYEGDTELPKEEDLLLRHKVFSLRNKKLKCTLGC